jgi:hypothetical protein
MFGRRPDMSPFLFRGWGFVTELVEKAKVVCTRESSQSGWEHRCGAWWDKYGRRKIE